jgi:hypothetical protein
MLNAKPAEIAEGALSFFQLLDGRGWPSGPCRHGAERRPYKSLEVTATGITPRAAGRSGNAEHRTLKAEG